MTRAGSVHWHRTMIADSWYRAADLRVHYADFTCVLHTCMGFFFPLLGFRRKIAEYHLA